MGCVLRAHSWLEYGEPEHHTPNGDLSTMPKIGYGSPGGFASRVALVNEIHRRAPDRLEFPSILTHLAVLRPECLSANEEWNKVEWEHLSKLCELQGEQPPPICEAHHLYLLPPHPTLSRS